MLADKAPLTGSNRPTVGAMINETSQEKKLQNYFNYQDYWQKTQEFTKKYMQIKRNYITQKDDNGKY